jgi:hypothetical protein
LSNVSLIINDDGSGAKLRVGGAELAGTASVLMGRPLIVSYQRGSTDAARPVCAVDRQFVFTKQEVTEAVIDEEGKQRMQEEEGEGEGEGEDEDVEEDEAAGIAEGDD